MVRVGFNNSSVQMRRLLRFVCVDFSIDGSQGCYFNTWTISLYVTLSSYRVCNCYRSKQGNWLRDCQATHEIRCNGCFNSQK
ncbi:hypothetical protein H5410_001488 [Solanum commersonii]|uniref:Uncharacterized protein n=1 Tax=Solanum commersonii TaxID=4109 RepID=A0A9J6AZU3_SOLCO|nr:hypothetical protein H5410_001488 [Solanum commersonii]